MPPPTHPFGAFNFRVEIDGLTSATFAECSGLGSESEVIEYREGGDPLTLRLLPGLTRFPRIVLKRGFTNNRELWNWRKSVVQGNVQRKNGVIVLMDATGTEVARWVFYRGWPARWEGPQLKAKPGEVAIETLEIVHEGLDLEE